MSSSIKHHNIIVNGCTFHVAVSEPNPPSSKQSPRKTVFCLHGFPEGWLGWRLLMRAMPDVRFIAPDLRGYPSSGMPKEGYDVFTLIKDIDLLIGEFNLDKPILLAHDWGGALGWIFAHHYPNRISQLVVVNCPHPKTLVRAVLQFKDYQTLRIPWVPPFQVPLLPEYLLTRRSGQKLLELSFTLREGSKGHMDKDLVREIVHRFKDTSTMRGPVNYYRDIVKTLINKNTRDRLEAIYAKPIQVPVALVWGLEDRALSAKVAQTSGNDAGCFVEWRPLTGIGHFVDLEAPELLAQELYRLPGLRDHTPASKKKAVSAA
tara:strand:- start:39727 stop:40680 length:954 start_codon:yes stop_codon:yes gene_type:complete